MFLLNCSYRLVINAKTSVYTTLTATHTSKTAKIKKCDITHDHIANYVNVLLNNLTIVWRLDTANDNKTLLSAENKQQIFKYLSHQSRFRLSK